MAERMLRLGSMHGFHLYDTTDYLRPFAIYRLIGGVWTLMGLFGELFDVTDTETESPTFTGMTLSSLTASRFVASDAAKALVSVSDLTSWIAGTTNQVTSTSDGDGTLTLSLPQDIHTGASPTFTGLNLSGLTASKLVLTGASKNLVSGGTAPQDATATANNFLTSFTASTGAFTMARPTWANIDKTVSDIADITTRSHTSLTDIGTLSHATIDTYLDQSVTVASSPTFSTVKLSGLTDGYVPYHVADVTGLANSGIYWNSANSRVGIGTASPTAKLEVNGASGSPYYRYGFVTGGAYPHWGILSTTVGAKEWSWMGSGSGLYVRNQTDLINVISILNDIPSSTLVIGGTELVINEGSNDYDFRVESDGNANMLFVDGGNNRVGVGTNAPGYTLDVRGDLYLGTTTQKLYFRDTAISIQSADDSYLDLNADGGIRLNAPVVCNSSISGVTTLSMSGQLTSTLATGTKPLNVTSTTVCTNLNADLWDGYQFADYLNQAVKTTSSPTFSGLTLSNKLTSYNGISLDTDTFCLPVVVEYRVDNSTVSITDSDISNTYVGTLFRISYWAVGTATPTGTLTYEWENSVANQAYTLGTFGVNSIQGSFLLEKTTNTYITLTYSKVSGTCRIITVVERLA